MASMLLEAEACSEINTKTDIIKFIGHLPGLLKALLPIWILALDGNIEHFTDLLGTTFARIFLRKLINNKNKLQQSWRKMRHLKV